MCFIIIHYYIFNNSEKLKINFFHSHQELEFVFSC